MRRHLRLHFRLGCAAGGRDASPPLCRSGDQGSEPHRLLLCIFQESASDPARSWDAISNRGATVLGYEDGCLIRIERGFASQRFLHMCYACAVSGCHYHYDVVRGYFLTSDGERCESDDNYREICPNHLTRLYIAAFDPQKSQQTWKCGQLECAESRITEGPHQASTSAP
jgi:hypothetical protein